jgi:hypothetical protein
MEFISSKIITRGYKIRQLAGFVVVQEIDREYEIVEIGLNPVEFERHMFLFCELVSLLQ